MTDALGNTTGYTYGSYNNLTQVIDARGNLTRYEYNDPRFPTLPTALVDDFNNRTTFTYTAEGYLETVTDANSVVTRHSYDAYGQRTQTVVNYVDGVYDPNTPDEDLVTTFVYDTIGRLSEIVDAQGRRQRMEYDAAGNVTRTVVNYVDGVYDPNTPDQDIVTSTVYDAAGRPTSVTDTLGRVTVFEYDNANRLTRVIRNFQDGVYSAAAPDQDVSTSYAYDAAGNQTRVTDVLGRANWTCYDSLNRPVRQVWNATGDGQTPQTNPCDAANYVPSSAADGDIITSAVYDANGNVVDSYDAGGVRTHYLYDQLNRQVAVIANFQDGIHVFDPADPAYDPPDRDVIALTYYDAVGNVEHTVDPAGHVTWLCYDDLNRRVRSVENASQTNPDPNSPANPCNAGYQPSTAADADLITTTVYDSLGRVQETVDSLGRRTRLVYDDAGRVVQRTANYQDGVYDPNAPDVDLSSQTIYDGLGRVFETIDVLGRHTRPVYDNLDRQVATIHNYQDGVYDPNTPDVDVRTATAYDGLGRVVSQTHPNTLTTTFIYDGLDRLVQVIDPLSQASHTVYDGAGNVVAATDPLGHTTTFAYDELDRQTAVTSQLQHTTTTTYDRLGRVVDRVDAEGLRATFGYDALGRLTSVIENATGAPIVNDPASPDVNVQTLYTYDVLGNLRTITLPGGAVITHAYDALGRRTATDGPLPGTVDLWTTTYDRGGREVQLTDPNNSVQSLGYDGLDRLTLLNYSDPATADVSFTYDAAGRRTGMSDGLGTTTFAYDGLNRLTGVVDPLSQAVTYGYDAGGRQVSLGLPGGRSVQYSYDSANRLTGVSDWDTATSDVVYQYDTASRMTGMTLPNGVQATFTYDDDNRLTGVRYEQGGQTLMEYVYTLDDVGNRLTATERLRAILPGVPGNCTPPPGQPTHTVAAGDVAGLVAAINASNVSGNADVISLAEGTYTLTAADNTAEGPTAFPAIRIGAGDCRL